MLAHRLRIDEHRTVQQCGSVGESALWARDPDASSSESGCHAGGEAVDHVTLGHLPTSFLCKATLSSL
ncbi:hypothetical protein GCM10009785_21320 [Brooklawnia cerclae]